MNSKHTTPARPPPHLALGRRLPSRPDMEEGRCSVAASPPVEFGREEGVAGPSHLTPGRRLPSWPDLAEGDATPRARPTPPLSGESGGGEAPPLGCRRHWVGWARKRADG